MPFAPASPTRFIFVGLIHPPGWNLDRTRKGEWIAGSLAFDFWASLPSAVRARGYRGHGTRACLGVCLLQGWRTRTLAHPVRARPRHGSSASGGARRARQAAYPLVGLGDPSLHFNASMSCHQSREGRGRLVAVFRRLPFSVLKGLMPGSSELSLGQAPCLRFRTVRERDDFYIRDPRRGAQPI